MLGMNCTLSATGTIPRRDAATFAGVGAAHDVDALPATAFRYFRDQSSYTFGSYSLALNADPAKTYWSSAYSQGRVQFIGGDSRCQLRADFFVVPSDTPAGQQVVVDEWDLTAGAKKTIGNCAVYAAARVRSTSQQANATLAPSFTSGTVTVGQSSYRWLKAEADGYTRNAGYSSDSLSFVPTSGWQYSTSQLVTFGAFWKSATLPAGVNWQAASELDEIWLFDGNQSGSGLTFGATRDGSYISVPGIWQTYSEQNIQFLSQQRWASDITFANRLESTTTRGPWPVAGYTPAAEYYGHAAGTLTYSMPVSLSLG